MNPVVKPSRSLLAAAADAIREFDLIRDGDRILVGVSGGKDSLSLLHVLLYLQQRAPVRFQIGAANIDPQMPGYHPSPLAAYAETLGVPYHQAYPWPEAIFPFGLRFSKGVVEVVVLPVKFHEA